MLPYLLRQSVSVVVTFALVMTLVFFGVRALPGDPASLRGGTEVSAERVGAMRRGLGLEAPLWRQFGAYWAALARGDLGASIRERRPVAGILLERLPVTASLAATAFALSLALGVPLGLLAGLRPNTGADRLVLAFTTLGLTLPEFWIGFLLLLLFAVQLPWFPLIGLAAEGGALNWLHHLALPALTLALPRGAQLARLTRAQVLEQRHADYLRTARAKGVRPPGLVRHLGANALPGLLPLLALELGGLLTGTIVVEQVFGLPGLGLAVLGAISARDYPVVQGITVAAVGVYVGVNWLADLAQALADPRLRYA